MRCLHAASMAVRGQTLHPRPNTAADQAVCWDQLLQSSTPAHQSRMPVSSPEVPLPSELFADLDRSGPVPMYYQLAQRLERAIESGALASGAKLENEVSLGEPTGALAAHRASSDAGAGRQGAAGAPPGSRGAVVRGRVGTRQRRAHEPLRGSGERSGLKPGTALLEHEIAPIDPAAARELGVEGGTDVLRIRRLHLWDGLPVAILSNTLAPELADLDVERLGRFRLVPIARQSGRGDEGR